MQPRFGTQGEFTDSDSVPAVTVFEGDTEITEPVDGSSDLETLPDIDGVEDEVSPAIPSMMVCSQALCRSTQRQISPKS